MRAGSEHERKLAQGQTCLHALTIHFGIELDAPCETLSPLWKTDRESQAVNQRETAAI